MSRRYLVRGDGLGLSGRRREVGRPAGTLEFLCALGWLFSCSSAPNQVLAGVTECSTSLMCVSALPRFGVAKIGLRNNIFVPVYGGSSILRMVAVLGLLIPLVLNTSMLDLVAPYS